jgi:hypothetical protein
VKSAGAPDAAAAFCSWRASKNGSCSRARPVNYAAPTLYTVDLTSDTGAGSGSGGGLYVGGGSLVVVATQLDSDSAVGRRSSKRLGNVVLVSDIAANGTRG